MLPWPWIVRAVAVAVALCLFMQWQSIGAQFAALLTWLLCVGGGELIIETSRRAQERRRLPGRPLRGGRRRTDPPAA
jgi:hypothetical protein